MPAAVLDTRLEGSSRRLLHLFPEGLHHTPVKPECRDRHELKPGRFSSAVHGAEDVEELPAERRIRFEAFC